MPGLSFPQQGGHLFGVQQPGNPQEVRFLLGTHGHAATERAAVEEHTVEGSIGVKGLEVTLGQLTRCVLFAIGFLEQVVVPATLHGLIEIHHAGHVLGFVERVIALLLHGVGEAHECGHRG